MKKFYVLMLSIFVFSTFAFAQEAEKKEFNPHAAYMEFDKLVHDYGTIIENGDGNCIFTLTNTGQEPLILTDCKSSCGCTVPEWSKAPLLPGKSTEIKVRYSTNRVGPINKTITITSNASNSPLVLRISGKVIKAAEQEQVPSKVSSGAVPVNEDKTN